MHHEKCSHGCLASVAVRTCMVPMTTASEQESYSRPLCQGSCRKTQGIAFLSSCWTPLPPSPSPMDPY